MKNEKLVVSIAEPRKKKRENYFVHLVESWIIAKCKYATYDKLI